MEVALGPSFESVSVYSTLSPTFGEGSSTFFVSERSATDGVGFAESLLFGSVGSGWSLVTSTALVVLSLLLIVVVISKVAVSPFASVPTL